MLVDGVRGIIIGQMMVWNTTDDGLAMQRWIGG